MTVPASKEIPLVRFVGFIVVRLVVTGLLMFTSASFVRSGDRTEVLDALLDELDRTMPPRQLPGLYLPVTEKLGALMPNTRKIEEAVAFFEDVGMKPIRTNAGHGKYAIGFIVDYSRLATKRRTHFRVRDVLVIRYIVAA